MRTIEEIVDKVRWDDHIDADYWSSDMVAEAVREYALEVISEIEENLWDYSIINLGQEFEGADIEAFQELKNKIKLGTD